MEEFKPKPPVKVKISLGEVTLRKPKSGGRRAAVIAAELPSPTSPTGSFIKWVIFWSKLLPEAIKVKGQDTNPPPFDPHIPLQQQLDELETEEEDALFDALKKFYEGEKEMQEALQGESQGLSTQSNSPKANGSETSSSSTVSAPSSVSAQKN